MPGNRSNAIRRLLARNRRRAADYLQDPSKLHSLVDKVEKKSKEVRSFSAPVTAALGNVSLLGRMLRSYVRREYRAVPWGVLLSAAAGLLYFVMPWDALPDFILGLGLVDDAALVAFIVGQIGTELNKFTAWEAQYSGSRKGRRKRGTLVEGTAEDRGVIEDAYLQGAPESDLRRGMEDDADDAAAQAILDAIEQADEEEPATPRRRLFRRS